MKILTSKYALNAILILLVSCISVSCKKNKQITLIGKWNVAMINGTFQQQGQEVQKSTETYQKGEVYLEFFENNIVTQKESDGVKSTFYAYAADTKKLMIDKTEYIVRELSEDRLVLYYEVAGSSNGEKYSISSEVICNKD